MHAFDILCDPRAGAFSGAITDVIGLSKAGVSQHLRVLRASVRAEGARRFRAVEPAALSEVDAWPDRFRRFWEQRLDALATELARGRRAAWRPAGGEPTRPAGSGTDVGKTDPSVKGA